MSFVNRVRVLAVVLIGLALAVPVAAQELLTDLAPLVGKWKGYVSPGSKPMPGFDKAIAMEMEIKGNGSYTGAVYLRSGGLPINGTLEVVGGKVRFKASDGGTGVWELFLVDGKSTLKGGRDDGSTINELTK